jgi:hypothetical protein
MKCPDCLTRGVKVELRRQRTSKTAVYCPECGWNCINGDGHIRVVGRPLKDDPPKKAD